MYLGFHVNMKDVAAGIDELVRRLTATDFWQAYVEPHPVRALLVLIAAFSLIVAVLSIRNAAVRKALDADRRVAAARHTAAYYKNKLKRPDTELKIRDRKTFRKCDPLPDGMVKPAMIEQMIWNWSYCRYVAGLIDRDAIATEKACERAKGYVRREVRRAYVSAESAVPDRCRIWVSYIDKKGRRRDRYRFTYTIEEVMAKAPLRIRKAAILLEEQGFRCAKCGKDPDDGVLFELSPDGEQAWCDGCAIGSRAADAIRESMANRQPMEE